MSKRGPPADLDAMCKRINANDSFYGLPEKQKEELNSKSLRTWGHMFDEKVNSWSKLEELNFYDPFSITVHYFVGFKPQNPTTRDLRNFYGYTQSCTEVFLARKIGEDKIQLNKKVCFSFLNGPTVETDTFVLHEDGSMEYVLEDGKRGEWERNAPEWEFTVFPVLPPVLRGVSVD